jgi:hypothetical protein
MDHVLVGMVTSSRTFVDIRCLPSFPQLLFADNDSGTHLEPSDFLVTLLRDPTSSHLLETLVSRCPDGIFTQLWSIYFHGKLSRLALHPIANFVVSKVIERLDHNQVKNTLEELSPSWGKAIRKHIVNGSFIFVKSNEKSHQEQGFYVVLSKDREYSVPMNRRLARYYSVHSCYGLH